MPYADKEKHKKHCRDYQKTDAGKASHYAANKAYRQRNKKKQAAHSAVSKAILRGNIIPWPVCAVPECNCKAEAHHPDYDAPLDVVWLCDTHHKEVHNMAREIKRNAK